MPLRWVLTHEVFPSMGKQEDDWLAFDEDFLIGSVHATQRAASGTRKVWSWGVSGIMLKPFGHEFDGHCDTLREAAIALRDAWRGRPAAAWAVGAGEPTLKRLNERDGIV